MTKTSYYVYLSDNGTLITPAYFEALPSIKKYRLIADEGYLLTQDGKYFYREMFIPASQLESWKEVPDKGQI